MLLPRVRTEGVGNPLGDESGKWHDVTYERPPAHTSSGEGTAALSYAPDLILEEKNFAKSKNTKREIQPAFRARRLPASGGGFI